MTLRLSRAVPIIGIATLACVVLIRLGLMTYWSLGPDGTYSPALLSFYWALALIVLAMLSRFAWQIVAGRHRSRGS